MKKYIIMFIESEWISLNIHDFNEYNEPHSFNVFDLLITSQTSDLIREFKSKDVGQLPVIIDLESFDKQMSQEGKEFKNYTKWTSVQLLKHHNIIQQDFKLAKSNLKLFMERLASYYLTQLEKKEEEKNRFESIELKINDLIYARQLKGVGIDIKLAEKKCQQIEKEIYNLKNKLQFEHKIYTPEKVEFQIDYLKEKNYRIIQSLQYTFKTRRNEDIICNLLYDLLRSIQDLNSLLYTIAYFGGQKRTHPWYLGFGTITSRIILRQPSLQNLRKVNRDIIVPDRGMKFFYIDYSQFEAGILASLSNDINLIELYNEDIYADLAEKVLGDKEKRSDAKVLFYRYIYGDDSLNNNTKKYFKEFQKLEGFRTQIETQITKKGKIGTINGNHRSRAEGGDSSWSLSHIIQSTASLIYKNALLSVYEKVSNSEFLIPMHDGTLYQISEFVYEDCITQIKDIYLNEFKKICPQIEGKVNTSSSFQ